RPQSLISTYLPDRAAAGGRPRAPQPAGAVPALAVAPGLAPIPHNLAADGVSGLCQAATARAAARPPLPGPLHASRGHYQSAAPCLCRWPGDLPVEGLPTRSSPAPYDA